MVESSLFFRRILTIISDLSLLVCILSVGFWGRSNERREEIQFRWRGQAYALALERGRVGIDNLPELRQFSQAVDRAQQDVRNSTAAYHGGSDNNDPYLADMIRAYNRLHVLTGRGVPTPVRYAIPYWAILLVALALPAIRTWKWHRRQRRIAANRCTECGYDLRATTGRCPECGTAIPATVLPNDASCSNAPDR